MTGDVSQIKELLECFYNTNKYKQKVNHQKTTERPKNQSKCDCTTEAISSSETIIHRGVELYGWVIELESKKEFQVMEIYENGSLLCVNTEYPDGKILERFEVE